MICESKLLDIVICESYFYKQKIGSAFNKLITKKSFHKKFFLIFMLKFVDPIN
jgi:hypothetical protein